MTCATNGRNVKTLTIFKKCRNCINVVAAFLLYQTRTNRIKIAGQLKLSGIFLLNLHK